MSANTAKFIKQLENFNGDARLYRLTPPLVDENTTTEYVIVSAVCPMGSHPETYIFAADAEGEVTNWREQVGSFRGALDHARALDGAGYTIEP